MRRCTFIGKFPSGFVYIDEPEEGNYIDSRVYLGRFLTALKEQEVLKVWRENGTMVFTVRGSPKIRFPSQWLRDQRIPPTFGVQKIEILEKIEEPFTLIPLGDPKLPISKCALGHDLEDNKGENRGPHYCDECEKIINIFEDDYLFCEECNFDICRSCTKIPNGFLGDRREDWGPYDRGFPPQ